MGLTARIPNLTPHSKKKKKLFRRALGMCLGVPSGLFSHANNSNTSKHSLCDASSCPSSLGEVGDVSMLQTCPQHVVSWLTGHLILADGQKGNSALVPPLELWLFSLTFLPETVVLVKWATKTSKP